jgi:hypothetical protein
MVDDKRTKFYYWNIFAVLVTFCVVILAGAVCITVVVVQANSMAVARYTLLCTSNFTGTALGLTRFDSASGSIDWNIQYTNIGNNVLAIYINGAIPVGLNVGPLLISLCGTPNQYACDTSIPGVLKGKVNSFGTTGLGPYITTVRDFPALYYVEIHFDVGSMRCPLGISAGW